MAKKDFPHTFVYFGLFLVVNLHWNKAEQEFKSSSLFQKCPARPSLEYGGCYSWIFMPILEELDV